MVIPLVKNTKIVILGGFSEREIRDKNKESSIDAQN